MHLYRRLLGFLKPHIVILILGFLFISVNTLTEGISLGILVPLSDNVLTGKDIVIDRNVPQFIDSFVTFLNSIPRLKLLNLIGLAIIVLILLKGLGKYGQQYFMQNLGIRVVRDIRNKLFEKYHNLSLDFFVSRKTGDLASKIIYDSTIVQNSLSTAFSDLVLQSMRVIMFSVIVFLINWRLSLLILLIAPFIILPIIRIGRVVRKVNTWAQEKMADINSTLYESISGIRIIKAFGMKDYEINKFRKFNQRFFRIGLKSIKRIEAISPISEFFGTVGAVIILLVGGRDVIRGQLSFGIFIFYLASLVSLVRPINRLSRVHGVNQIALAAAERIFNILDLEPTVKEIPGAKILKEYKKCVIYDSVSFAYDDEEVLKDISFKVKKGEVLAIVGPTSSGKTTLVNLLPRFYDPKKGRVLIDEEDIRNYTLNSLRNKIGLVTQEIILFNDTIKENIRYGNREANDEKVVDAAKAALAHDFINNMPRKYNTLVGDRGLRLSGGEKQRVSIARAILKNAPILILDEATSQLDAESEKLVQQAMDKLMKDKTVFVIAHRLSTIKRADNILVIERGRIIQLGPHDTLVKQRGLYKKLYSLQFSDIEI